jgi:hypothetical protein
MCNFLYSQLAAADTKNICTVYRTYLTFFVIIRQQPIFQMLSYEQIALCCVMT